MSHRLSHIVLLYNEDTEILHGAPTDSIAVQSTVATAESVFQALLELEYPVYKAAIRESLEEIEQHLSAFDRRSTLVFNCCDGFRGVNRGAVDVIRRLEELGFAHTGANFASAQACIYKPITKAILIANGVETPAYQVFHSPNESFRLPFPAIVKPAAEDGSIGITHNSVVTNLRELRREVERVLVLYCQPALVETFIPGREFSVSILGNQSPEILPIAEQDYSRISDPLAQLLTYQSKWDPAAPEYYDIPALVPADLSKSEEQLVRETARRAFQALGLRDLGRIDLRLLNGIPYVLEVNELPDLAPEAGFWNSARAAGMTYPQLIDRIVQHALKREGWTLS
ncbi:MAG: ATP-grasp domain-containing protein [Anaerolineales bacterium]|nr:ATP-grasp domain-containing protein [Anaerolineales bacterium]MCX7609835.1 ATP-grasp domain-containing protein [Anaerolineales bacterium]MDW8226490.1 ATP-grasp domain-containing protein [Anaerolineales bacterium]